MLRNSVVFRESEQAVSVRESVDLYNAVIAKELARAREQLKSDDDDDVLAGCQTIRTFADKDALTALSVARDKWHANARVALYVDRAMDAQHIMKRMEGTA
jgi:hypothetical protein